jgi:hypothetical protein
VIPSNRMAIADEDLEFAAGGDYVGPPRGDPS